MPDEYLWMLTSLVHDYGYIKSGIAQKENLEVLDAKYHLLSDICTFKQLESTRGYSCKYPQFLTYSYETIINYYNYRNSTLNPYLNKDHEANDHGIYGACKCYEEYSDFYIKKEYPYYCITINDDPDDIKRMGYDAVRYNERPEIVKLARTEPLLYKTACLITAQHNMFKSSETTEDSEYKRWGLYPLLSTEPIAIDNRNPLLFLLSIVDTIDCTKRFEKLLISGESRISIPIKKVLKNIRIQFDDDGIIVDYTPLFLAFNKYFSLLNSKRKRDVLQTEIYNQVEAVIRLKNWVKCETRPLEPFIVKILLLT